MFKVTQERVSVCVTESDSFFLIFSSSLLLQLREMGQKAISRLRESSSPCFLAMG